MATIGDFKAEVERYGKDLYIQELEQRVEKLEQQLHEIREIYAGMEGFEPQTAPEAYCLRIIEQMAKALARRGE